MASSDTHVHGSDRNNAGLRSITELRSARNRVVVHFRFLLIVVCLISSPRMKRAKRNHTPCGTRGRRILIVNKRSHNNNADRFLQTATRVSGCGTETDFFLGHRPKRF